MTTQKPISTLIFLCFAIVLTAPAFAHRVNVFAWVDSDTVHVEGKFPGGKHVKGGKVIVADLQGNEVASGLTDENGSFSFKITKRTGLKILLIAGQGHQAEWTIRETEIPDAKSETVTEVGAEKSRPPERTLTIGGTPSNTRDASTGTNWTPEELEPIIESVLDRKLKPITRMLTDRRQEGATVKDILGGIGYILGLVGIAAYIKSRQTKA